MKWFRMLLAIFLSVGMLLCVSSVAYAGDGDEDPGLTVDIVVVGDNPDVTVDVQGEDSEVTVNTSGTEVYLNGQNINEPTVIYRTNTTDRVARYRINILDAGLEETQGVLSLTMDGLAKLIVQVQGQDSSLMIMSGTLDEHSARLDDIDGQVAGLNDQFSDLSGRIWESEIRHNALATDVEEGQAAMLERLDKMELDYNRKLLIMAGVFLAVVLGLGIGFRRLRKRIT